MAQIGTVKLNTETGVEDVPVFETSDVDTPIVRVQTDSGPGALNLVDPESADLQELRVHTSNNGVLAVSTTISSGTGGLEATVAATLNGQTAKLLIYEDETGDGTADSTEMIDLEDGTNTYTASQVSGESGNDYWIELELENSDIEESAVIDYVELESVSAVATVDASIETDTTAEITVFEDTSGDGEADNNQTVTLEDGTNSYSLTDLEGGEGNEYWIQIHLSNSDIEKTAVINNIELSV